MAVQILLCIFTDVVRRVIVQALCINSVTVMHCTLALNIIFSPKACCTSDYNRAKMMGKCALTCDIIALSTGIATFILMVIPGILVGVLFGIGVLGSAAETFGLYDGAVY